LNDKTFLATDFNETVAQLDSNNVTETSANNETSVQVENTSCGSCYGAGEEDECCNTCDEVRHVYKKKGWVLHNIASIKQCASEGEVKEEKDEGCNVHGVVALSTGGGNLHLAPGKDSDEGPGFTLFDLLLEMFQQWNVTHTVHKIRFGPEYPAAVYQLDGVTRTITDTYGMYQYYFQVRCERRFIRVIDRLGSVD
jgi:hypothetical protein